MELYAQYIKEREDVECVYDNNCFLTYKETDEDSITVFDIYSSPEVRGTGAMKEFCDKFYSELDDKYKIVFGMVYTNTNGWKYSDKVMQKYGFKFIGIDPYDENKRNYAMILDEKRNEIQENK